MKKILAIILLSSCLTNCGEKSVNNMEKSKKANSQALLMAAEKNDIKKAEEAINNGADVNFQIGWTALMHAAFNGNKELVQLLIKHKADVNKSSINGTALTISGHTFHREIEKLLIDNGAQY